MLLRPYVRLSLVVAALFATPARAADDTPNWTKPPSSENPAPPSPPSQAVIPFARQHGIFDWHVADEKTVYIESIDRQWYKAALMFRCVGIQFAMDRLGFTFEANGDFDKFSAIHYHDQDCPLASLTKSDPPPGYKGKKASNPPVPAQRP
jgi:hypothetical protein